jgi:hypothetical protein
MYVNDIPLNPSLLSDAAQFADDVSVWTMDKKKSRAVKLLQLKLKALEPWLMKWRIKVNCSKTQFITFNTYKANQTLTFLGHTIKEQKHIKILGVHFERGFSMGKHCSYVASKAARRTNMLRRLRGNNWGASRQRLLMFYKQFIRPVIEYGYQASRHAKDCHRRKIQRAQNSALRVILRLPMKTRITKLQAIAKLPDMSSRIAWLQARAEQRYQNSPLLAHKNITETFLKQK